MASIFQLVTMAAKVGWASASFEHLWPHVSRCPALSPGRTPACLMVLSCRDPRGAGLGVKPLRPLIPRGPRALRAQWGEALTLRYQTRPPPLATAEPGPSLSPWLPTGPSPACLLCIATDDHPQAALRALPGTHAPCLAPTSQQHGLPARSLLRFSPPACVTLLSHLSPVFLSRSSEGQDFETLVHGRMPPTVEPQSEFSRQRLKECPQILKTTQRVLSDTTLPH